MRKDKKRNDNLKKEKSGVDKILLGLVLLLTLIGVLAVANASAPQAQTTFGDAYYFAKQQLMWAGLGLIGMIVFTIIDNKLIAKYATPIFLFSILLLILVLIPGIGVKVYGARRWISVAGFTLQPSEISKLALSIFIARLAQERKPWKIYWAAIGVTAFLILLEPNLGTTLIVVSLALGQVFAAGVPMLQLFIMSSFGAISSALLVITSNYRRQRLFTFLESVRDPFASGSDKYGSSYHVRQILIALGSGGIFGVGLGQGRQKYLFLPETASDSIFATIAEEVGFVGAFIIIVLYLFLLIRLLKVASKSNSEFGRIYTVGVTCWIAAQMFLNIASIVSLIPLTGIPLPFISYGGSSLTMMLVSIGIALNISKDKKIK